jgi:hypothetical protein
MLTKDQRKLLTHIIDALDRLFDHDAKVIDTYAVLYATWQAFTGTPIASAFESPVQELEKLVRFKTPEAEKRNLALVVTDDLLKFVADELRQDAIVNPKQRHKL